MTFDARETSTQEGQPFELFTFTVYGVAYRFTSASEDIVIGPATYLAYPMSRSEIEETDELPKNNVEITVPNDFPMLSFYDVAPPSEVILLTIHRMHRDDSELQPWWSGRVLNAGRKEDSATLYCENVYTSLRRSGLRRKYSKNCPHVLYGLACGVINTLHRVTITVDGVDGVSVSSILLDSFPDGRFAGGFIEWEPTPGQIERRGIKSHVGAVITLTHPAPSLAALSSAFVFKGCQHNITDCNDTFDNADRYGGFPYIPRQNPMGQFSVF